MTPAQGADGLGGKTPAQRMPAADAGPAERLDGGWLWADGGWLWAAVTGSGAAVSDRLWAAVTGSGAAVTGSGAAEPQQYADNCMQTAQRILREARGGK